MKEFDKITPEDLKRIAKDVFQRNKFKLSVVGPLTTKDKEQIKSIFDVI